MRTDDGSIIQACLNGEPEAFGLLVGTQHAVFLLSHSLFIYLIPQFLDT